jgi:broad specificity phosphatase PhoE
MTMVFSVGRIWIGCLLLICVCWFPLGAFCQNEGVIFLVRHAERAAGDAALLNAAGEERARCLAQTLRDAHITKIFATDVKRTQQTAEPLARQLHLELTVVPKNNTDGLLRDLQESKKDRVLVVGHADTLPTILERLGAGSLSSDQMDYDRMMIVPVLDGKTQPVISIHYCAPAK